MEVDQTNYQQKPSSHLGAGIHCGIVGDDIRSGKLDK